MRDIAIRLSVDWTLRTGGADGADEAFALGAIEGQGDMEIFLPWRSYNGFDRRNPEDKAHVALWQPSSSALSMAGQFHPAWSGLSNGEKALHGRNMHQILGVDVNNPDLSRFVVCWTPEASGSGGTGQAIRVAKHYGVPVFDLADESVQERMLAWMRGDSE